MVIATLIASILTLIATIFFPCFTMYTNRLRLSVFVGKTYFKKNNIDQDFIVHLSIKNAGKSSITIHKIELHANKAKYLARYEFQPLRNKIIDEHEETEFDIVFNNIRFTYKDIKALKIYTNKKNFSLSISE